MLNVNALLGHTKRERHRQVRVGSRRRPRRWSLSERSGKLGQRPKLPGQLPARDFVFTSFVLFYNTGTKTPTIRYTHNHGPYVLLCNHVCGQSSVT